MRLQHLLVAIISLVSSAIAQDKYAINGYKYDGCVQVDSSRFELTHPHPAGGRTPEDCEEICRGSAYVGVFDDACRCGNNIGEINRQNEDVCNNPCKGDPSLGWCGSDGPTCDRYANLYCAILQQPIPNYPTSSIWNPTSYLDSPGSYTYAPSPWTSECPGSGIGNGSDGWGYGTSSVWTLNGHTFTPTSWTMTTLTTALATYTYHSHTSSSATTWTTTLSGASEAYTTLTYTSVSRTVIPGEYTSTAETTYVTPTVALNGGGKMEMKGGVAMGVVAIVGMIVM